MVLALAVLHLEHTLKREWAKMLEVQLIYKCILSLLHGITKANIGKALNFLIVVVLRISPQTDKREIFLALFVFVYSNMLFA